MTEAETHAATERLKIARLAETFPVRGATEAECENAAREMKAFAAWLRKPPTNT